MVLQRSRLAEARQRAINQTRIEFRQAFVVDAEAARHTGAKVMDQYVGLLHQLKQDRQALGLFQVEHQPALAAVHAEEGAAFAGERGGIAPQVVAVWRFDLDDFGALVGQQGAAIGAGDIGTQVEYADSGQRAGARCRSSASACGAHVMHLPCPCRPVAAGAPAP